MGREVRMVPPDWKHPRGHTGKDGQRHFRPLHDQSFEEAVREWEAELREWEAGKRLWEENGMVETASSGLISVAEAVAKYGDRNPPPRNPPPYSWWSTRPHKPQREDYMPDWPAEQRTHYMMYEDTSEGTPISPAFATPEELARWLADTGASAFADCTATYEQWLATIRRRSAISAVMTVTPAGAKMVSGVEALAEMEE